MKVSSFPRSQSACRNCNFSEKDLYAPLTFSSLYTRRTAGGDRNYRYSDRNLAASPSTSQGTGQPRRLHEQPQAVDDRDAAICQRLERGASTAQLGQPGIADPGLVV